MNLLSKLKVIRKVIEENKNLVYRPVPSIEFKTDDIPKYYSYKNISVVETKKGSKIL